MYTAIWWYASFPDHYSGDSAGANARRGEMLVGRRIDGYVDAIRAIEADESAPRLQREFFGQVERPGETPQ